MFNYKTIHFVQEVEKLVEVYGPVITKKEGLTQINLTSVCKNKLYSKHFYYYKLFPSSIFLNLSHNYRNTHIVGQLFWRTLTY